MIRLIFQHLGWKLFALLLAFALWLAFVGRPELARSISVPIEYQNMPAGLEMSANVPEQVRLDVRGSSSRLNTADFSGAAVLINLAGVQDAGEQTFNIDQQNARLPFGVQLMRAIPSQIRIDFEQQLTRQIPIKAQFTNVPSGYRIQSDAIHPSKLTISGPESRVRAIEFAETDPIDLSKTVSEAEFRAHVFLPDPQVRVATRPIVRVRVVLAKK